MPYRVNKRLTNKKFKSNFKRSFPGEARTLQRKINDLIRDINKEPMKELYITLNGEEIELCDTIRLKIVDYDEEPIDD